jgi:hypothetical protein
MKVLAYKLLGNKCNSLSCRWNSGQMDEGIIHVLQIDHIKGDGALDRLMHGHNNVKNFLRVTEEQGIDRAKEQYQLLCPTCNWLKRFKNKETRKRGLDKILSDPVLTQIRLTQIHDKTMDKLNACPRTKEIVDVLVTLGHLPNQDGE